MPSRQVGAFGLVGIASTLLYAALSLTFARAGLSWVLASSLAYCTGMVISYSGHRWFTFASARPHGEAIPRFLLLNLFGFGVSLTAPWMLTDMLGLPPIIAIVTTSVVVPTASYVGHRLVVFPDRISHRLDPRN